MRAKIQRGLIAMLFGVCWFGLTSLNAAEQLTHVHPHSFHHVSHPPVRHHAEHHATLHHEHHAYHVDHHSHHLSHLKHTVQPDLALQMRGGGPPTLGQSGVCSMAKSELGKPYVWGGDTPSDGFDCSGFSQYVYGKEGVDIPRTASAQYASLTPVHHLQNGDLVFFRTFGHHVSHVGIYLGNGYFIHSPRTGERIRIDSIDDPYWRERYAGARRVLTNQA